MRVYRLFVISTCRFQYLAENQTKLEENLKDVGFRGTHGTCFSLVCVVYKNKHEIDHDSWGVYQYQCSGGVSRGLGMLPTRIPCLVNK